ncbi:MAG: hypothetical protein ACK44W_13700, partial [Planctomycetota bacterium]
VLERRLAEDPVAARALLAAARRDLALRKALQARGAAARASRTFRGAPRGRGRRLAAWGIAAAAAAVAVPAALRVRENARLSECQAQCSGVFFALASYHAEHGKYPDGAGPALLKQLLDAEELGEEPRCPYTGTPSFRGPARDMNLLEDTDVIFCDEPRNHPDGSINVLRKNGKVETLRPGTPDYDKALQTTKGK